MNQRGSIFILFIAFLLGACSDDAPIPDNIAEIRPLTEQEKTLLNSSNTFSFELLRMLKDQNPGTNIFFSPIGLGNGIGMSLNIIQDKPKQELKNFLRISNVDDIQVDRAYYQLSEVLDKIDKNVTITGGNSLWINNQYAITELTGDKLMAYYKADVDFLNFNNENAVRTVNRWAANSTNGKMDKVISEINPKDRAYIINTMHFDMGSALPVESANIDNYHFTLPEGKSIKCNLVKILVTPVKYNSVNGLKIIDVPVGTGKFHMILLEPQDNQKLNILIQNITPALLNSFLKSTQATTQAVYMPELNLNKEIRLKKIFPQLGISEPISTMKYYFDNREVFISDFIHKSSLSIGINVAVNPAKSAELNETNMANQLIINRPFLFIIREEYTGGVIFNGIIDNPLSE